MCAHKVDRQEQKDGGKVYVDPAIDPEALISVIVPLFNEEGSVEELFSGISKVMDSIGRSYEVIFVDDGSTDDSFGRLAGLYNSNPEVVRVVQFRRNKGKADALSTGFDMAEGEIIITMDGDLQDDPEEIPRFLKKLAEGSDLVTGWKKKRKDPLHKVISSRIFNFFVSIAAGLKLHDYNCGFKAYRKEVIDELQLYGELHRFIPFLANSRGFRVEEIPVRHLPRKSGASKYGWSRHFKGFFDFVTVIMLTRFSRRPLHFFGAIGLVLFLAGLAINLYLTWLWLWNQPIGDRPLLILGVLLMVVGVQVFTIGLLGEMINVMRPRDESDSPVRRILK